MSLFEKWVWLINKLLFWTLYNNILLAINKHITYASITNAGESKGGARPSQTNDIEGSLWSTL